VCGRLIALLLNFERPEVGRSSHWGAKNVDLSYVGRPTPGVMMFEGVAIAVCWAGLSVLLSLSIWDDFKTGGQNKIIRWDGIGGERPMSRRALWFVAYPFLGIAWALMSILALDRLGIAGLM